MTIFQLILLAAAAFFAYQVYMHIQNIDEDAEPLSMQEPEQIESEPSVDELIEAADQAYMDGQIEEAQRRLEEVVERYPEVAEGLNKLAFVLAKQEKLDEARRLYEASLRIDNNDDMTHNAMATLLVRMDRLDEAAQHYEMALGIDESYEVTWFNYANLMQLRNENDRAKEMYAKALEINPDFEEAKEELEKLA